MLLSGEEMGKTNIIYSFSVWWEIVLEYGDSESSYVT